MAVATQGYKNVTGISKRLATKCAYHVHETSDYHKSIKTFLVILFTFIIAMVLVSTCCGASKLALVEKLRRTPSYQLHRAVEEEYRKRCVTREKDKRAWDLQGDRYVSVGYVDDNTAMRRTITVVEDLRLVPQPRATGGNRSNNNNNRNAYQGRAAELQDRENAGYRSGGGVAQPEAPVILP